MTETWTTRDLPILVATAELVEASPGAGPHSADIAPKVGMEHADVMRALVALAPTYITVDKLGRSAGLAGVVVTSLTDEGRRAVGMWPDRADHLAALIAALDGAAEDVEDEEERTRVQRLREALSGAPKRIAEGVVAGVIAGQVGG
jgi:hypothetical protein